MLRFCEERVPEDIHTAAAFHKWLANHDGALAMSLVLVLRRPIERAGPALLVAVAVYGVATVAFPQAASREQQQAAVRTLSEHPLLRYVQPLTVATP